MKKFYACFLVIAMLNGVEACFSQNINVTLADQLTYSGQNLSNLWGWKDPADGKEYALVGAENGMSVVDVSNPSNVFEVVQIPGPSCTWREIRTVGNYAYITSECGTIGLQIVDLTNLPATNLTTATWTPTISGTTLETIHALHADGGKVYLYGSNVGNGGCIIADVSSPMAPVYLGSYDPRYIHDGCVFNDTLYAGHIYDGEVSIVNLTNPTSPQILDVFSTPTNFTHNTWLNYNHKYCFTTDENNNSFLGAFDVSTLGNVFEVDRIQSNPGSNSMVHNTYIVNVGGNDYAVTSWYKDGFTIVDAQRPHNLVQTGNYDTAPTASGSGSANCWGVYPYLPSGTILASDMSNGLFVCAPTYTKGCHIEGVITDCATGNPLSGVTVTVQSPGPSTGSSTDISDALGKYAVGVLNPGTYTVTFSKQAYATQSVIVTASTGVVTMQNIQLCSNSTPFTYTGNVFNTVTTAGIPGANVYLQDSTIVLNILTDASGNFTIPGMLAGNYDVVVGAWGYVTQCFSNQSISAASGPLSVGLTPGIYDDFSFDWGWTVSGTCPNAWELGEPVGTIDVWNGNAVANPDKDNQTDCSDKCYVTDNGGGGVSDNDVDPDGYTILTSPVFNPTSMAVPMLFYSRWFYTAMLSGNQPNDTMNIYITNGTNTVQLEEITKNTAGKGTWVDKQFKISDYVSVTSTMQIILSVSDAWNSLGPPPTGGTVVEGALDKFFVIDSVFIGVNELENYNAEVVVYPNPVSEVATIEILNYNLSNTSTEFVMFDVFGREVKKMSVLSPKFQIERDNLSSGIYLYKIKSAGKIITTGKISIE